MYSDLIYYAAIATMFVLTAYFFIISFMGTGPRFHSFIILSSSLICISMPEVTVNSPGSFIEAVKVAMLIDGVTALSMCMVLFFDKSACKHAGLLIFATIVHIVVLYDLTIASSVFTLLFYNYYDELIITVGIFQMMVSSNGFTTALRNLRGYLSWSNAGVGSVNKSYYVCKQKESTQ